MKKVLFFYLPHCPYCIKAKKYLDELFTDMRYAEIDIEAVDESKQKSRCDAYDYSLVPCFYIDNVKVQEGISSYADIKKVLEKAL